MDHAEDSLFFLCLRGSEELMVPEQHCVNIVAVRYRGLEVREL